MPKELTKEAITRKIQFHLGHTPSQHTIDQIYATCQKHGGCIVELKDVAVYNIGKAVERTDDTVVLLNEERQTIWSSTLDNRYECRVQRVSDYVGELSIKDTQTNKEHSLGTVVLSYRAVFGPDIGDVAAWEEACVQFVDRLSENKK